MDLPQEELQLLSTTQLLKHSITIPKHSPQTFYRVTLTLIFPLSFAILAHSLFTHPLITKLQQPHTSHTSQWTKLLIFQFSYLIFLFIFSLLSTAAIVFTVASIYTSKPVSFADTISAIPSVFKRLLVTFLWVGLIMVVYNIVFLGFFVLFLVAIYEHNYFLFYSSLFVVCVLFFVVHTYVTAIWHLASVVSVLEPVYGFDAMRKSFEILKGRVWMGSVLVFGYYVICGVINWLFGYVVVHGGDNSYGVFSRIVVGGLLVGGLVVVNLVGFLVQSVFYLVCKSYHHQGIDKSVLYEHLGGYVGLYVPLKGSVQMEEI